VKIKIVDLMISIVAIAAGAALTRALVNYCQVALAPENDPELTTTLAQLGWAMMLAQAWLAPLSLAVLALKLRGPRPSIDMLAQQPGAVACGAAASIMAVRVAFFFAMRAVRGRGFEWQGYFVRPYLASQVGAAVVASWIVLALGRRWRPEPSWVDRMGRLLGACWVLVFLVASWQSTWSDGAILVAPPLPPPPVPSPGALP
jgi:hypothetical protein